MWRISIKDYPRAKNSSRHGNGRLHRQRNADDAGVAGLWWDDFQFAVMGLDDFPADSQAEAEADVARCVKGRGNAFGSFGGETGAAVLHFNLEILPAALARPGLEVDIH